MVESELHCLSVALRPSNIQGHIRTVECYMKHVLVESEYKKERNKKHTLVENEYRKGCTFSGGE